VHPLVGNGHGASAYHPPIPNAQKDGGYGPTMSCRRSPVAVRRGSDYTSHRRMQSSCCRAVWGHHVRKREADATSPRSDRQTFGALDGPNFQAQSSTKGKVGTVPNLPKVCLVVLPSIGPRDLTLGASSRNNEPRSLFNPPRRSATIGN